MNKASVQSKFTNIYKTNAWGSRESVSGPGSTLNDTLPLRGKLQDLLKRYGVESLLDLPCGDFNWMRHMNLDGIYYIGGDIVRELVLSNRATYGSKSREFHEIDLVSSRLPKVDMIFCRDALVHLPDEMVKQSIENIKRSGSTWLVATTFPNIELSAKGALGGWRPVNLCDEKFGLPHPEELLIEKSHSSYGRKCMGVWYIGDL